MPSDRRQRRPVVAIIGTGNDGPAQALSDATELGALVGKNRWVLLTGGRNAGVMAAATDAAHRNGGMTVGILPRVYEDEKLPSGLDVAIFTDLHHGRNNVLVLSAHVVVACGVDGPGTASEVALALKNRKKVVLLNASDVAQRFFASIGGDQVVLATSAAAAMQAMEKIIGERGHDGA